MAKESGLPDTAEELTLPSISLSWSSDRPDGTPLSTRWPEALAPPRAGRAARFWGVEPEGAANLKKLASLEGHFESPEKMAKSSTKHSARHARAS
jgi:hypothetical protein